MTVLKWFWWITRHGPFGVNVVFVRCLRPHTGLSLSVPKYKPMLEKNRNKHMSSLRHSVTITKKISCIYQLVSDDTRNTLPRRHPWHCLCSKPSSAYRRLYNKPSSAPLCAALVSLSIFLCAWIFLCACPWSLVGGDFGSEDESRECERGSRCSGVWCNRWVRRVWPWRGRA
jgi:hypothetical protein